MISAYDTANMMGFHELRSQLSQLGAGFSRKETKQDLVRRYVEITSTLQPQEKPEEQESKPVVVAEPIEESALDAIFKEYKHLQVVTDECSWTAAYGRLSVSGSKTMPEARIRRELNKLCGRAT